ncbi:putative tagatose 6-phosphate kinase-like protein (plasmid) [Streptantibioticus cattleyicolor NRRL 8057 = DSM 46488]|uniref:Putative tagatose 6-phosphate kinase-like protein n=1 Tax=Streptantibioticus cattleyicolor (strain ATCC 35852 / DSM 46488 / JCM 4925 / NBRC 14057 / NRRL 8057) TaxID=1003195 RepID=G8XGK4_STREN|nr:putative tagatose 6-phosphate kinase-like protein [Streptantibioticus cattleyicolor NRRL 8057 = DSM 46488]
MSRNSVDACIAVAHRFGQPLMLIPSRRQIEAAELGGGYVEGWTTEQFARYVREQDPKGLVLLCRDHGGPYQLPRERSDRIGAEQAMRSALDSFREDIRNGFDLLHIDTSMDRQGPAPFAVAADRLVALYGECWEAARSADRRILFEIGFEDQGTDTNDPGEFRDQIRDVLARLESAGLPAPTFAVAQTGTKVLETGNTGGPGPGRFRDGARLPHRHRLADPPPSGAAARQLGAPGRRYDGQHRTARPGDRGGPGDDRARHALPAGLARRADRPGRAARPPGHVPCRRMTAAGASASLPVRAVPAVPHQPQHEVALPGRPGDHRPHLRVELDAEFQLDRTGAYRHRLEPVQRDLGGGAHLVEALRERTHRGGRDLRRPGGAHDTGIGLLHLDHHLGRPLPR